MGDRDDAFDPEELLQHAGWMKALAAQDQAGQ